MNEKWKNILTGVLIGVVVGPIAGFWMAGWKTGGAVQAVADAAVSDALLPVCADSILANSDAVAALKTKRTSDYDDVVRDHLKSVGNRTSLDFQFRRDCGKVIEARLAKSVTK